MQLTIGRAALDKLREAQGLLRHAGGVVDDGALFERAMDALLAELSRRKLGAVRRAPPAGRPSRPTHPPKPGSRHVPADVRREVHARDGDRCAYVGPQGRRGEERGGLAFHHVKPCMAGGEATAGNIQLRCRQHNAYESRAYYARPDWAPGVGPGAGPP